MRTRILRAIRDAAKISSVLMLLVSPTFTGTVTCAGKAYHDIAFATITGSAGIQLVRMWTVQANNPIATRHTMPKWALTINNEMLCEFEDVNVRIIDPSIASSADGD